MLIEILISIIIGTELGIVTGIIPGLHINFVGTLLLSITASYFSKINPLYFCIFIVSLSVVHIFVDFIPSIFLGCPNSDNQLSILPGHKMLLKGRGYGAISLTSKGALFGSIALIILFIPSLYFLTPIYEKISSFMFFILFGIFAFFILTEKDKIHALLIFLLSGVLGICVLNSQINEPLLPLFTGLFGMPLLISSLNNKIKIPYQKIQKIKVNPIKPFIVSLIISPLCGFLPGLGSGESVVLASTFIKTNEKEFLFLNGLMNNLVMGLSFISLYLLSKTRTGSAVVIKELMGNFSLRELMLILIVFTITSVISYLITIYLGKKAIYILEKINYQKISLFTLSFLIILVIMISGFGGLIILITSTLLGIYSNNFHIRKSNMMGCLLIPTMIYYLKLLV